MSTVLDYLKAPEFADDKLTESINIPPYQTGRPAQLGIFSDEPIATTYVKIGYSSEEITIIPSRERGGESNLNMRGDRQGVMIEIPHFPLDDKITPSDLQNLLAWGDDRVFETLGGVYNRKLTSIRSKHDATHAHLDWGALNGLVIDAEGKLLLDLYDKFDIAQTVISFDLDIDTTDVSAKNRLAKAAVRKALRGTASTGMIALAGPEFFDRYVGHKWVRESLQNYPTAAVNPARDEVQDTFTFAGLRLERVDEEFNYRRPDGTFLARPAVADDEAILIPLGTPHFKRYIAPPDTISDANRAPRPTDKIFISTEDLKHGKGQEIHSESNVMPICTRPDLMVKITMEA
ncbi:major capsid protein [Agrobacterium pusense]|uniref:major capsid protein n=1 Tax=Agrobacterium pusense TaxID=648995 RepID=UPI000D19F204|nr:major capsid protein [Agrobacterium pusense]